MRFKLSAFLLLPMLAVSLLIWLAPLAAKPKVAVLVRMDNGFGVKPPDDALSKSGYSFDGPLPSSMIYYMNVVVRSDDAGAVAKNNGQWCLKGDFLLESFEYHGVMDGNNIEVEIPRKNGKTKKATLKIYDRKWHKESDI